MTYKVLAYRKTTHTKPVETPAIVSDAQGRLSLITASSPQFEAVPDHIAAEYMETLTNEAPEWWHTSVTADHPWTPGTYVAADHKGNYHLRTPEDGEAGHGGTADTASVALADEADPLAPVPIPKGGELETYVGDATNHGHAFRFDVHLTGCHACKHFNPRLTAKLCRLPTDQVTTFQQGYYERFGQCPHFEFGWTVDAGDDMSETRGALIKALGGDVSGQVSTALALTGTAKKVAGWVGADDDDEGGNNE